MVRLAREILAHLVAEYGPEEVLRRLSDPFWFQAFGCVLGFDWHSSGVTTTVCGALKASKLAAKVDNTAVRDGHQLYHHTFMFTPSGSWCVVQQCMSDLSRTARRYHWLSEGLASFVDEPHAAVCCDVHGTQLNMVAGESAAAL
jgi:hypothetical protein